MNPHAHTHTPLDTHTSDAFERKTINTLTALVRGRHSGAANASKVRQVTSVILVLVQLVVLVLR